ncbi:MAG: ABC transporter permease [Candidatus Rokubacteria bacterium 13_1_20CM_2_68_19]|nr:MAG: ABC transporter permease [Candidatus Rokubacteria bacterium 13_2_20CM_69_10]OLB42263.1 MAG: ABC transporter permease [Candidatus Rokubacteria bacterium 13_2_20CM_2_64_8]OLE42704.1 MAG: ABC transporter permease [Candidatus Rokubacteria bacterium 13_1_20CM_2_68_19]PYN62764.1 MAG: ABC transporter permease [Candidatus Rokubacteria bacterium]
MRGAAWAETAAISAAALLAALGVFGGFVALRGLNPLDVYAALVAGGFGSWFSLEETLTQAAPIMLTALCTALPARAGLLVIGGEGALVVGGVATVLAGVNLGGLPPPLAVALMCLAGALGGGLWVGVAGALRHWRGVNETIATLLLNYIAIAVMNHLVAGPIRDFGQVLKPASWAIGERLMIGTIPATGIHWGLVFGVVACVVTWVLMRHTIVGFAVDVVGGNVRAAQMVGLPIGAIVLATTVLGGAAAGLAGAIEVVAVHGFASSSLVVGYGYAGILVAFLARQNPLAVIAVAVLLGGITASGGLLQRRFGLPDAATLVLEGLLFIALLAANTLYGRFRRSSGD